MPLYTFECAGCGHRDEVLVAYRERERYSPVCEKCGGNMIYTGRIEVIAHRDFGKGRYRFGLVTGRGEEIKVGTRGDS